MAYFDLDSTEKVVSTIAWTIAILWTLWGIAWKFRHSLRLFSPSPLTKETTKILFVDDEEFEMVDILKKDGFVVTRISDVDWVEDPALSGVKIFFIDVQWVGVKMKFVNEWFWLAKFIKEKFPNSKVWIYSTHKNHFDDALESIDFTIRKDADAYRFHQKISSLISKLNQEKNGS